eukprot:scaffold139414_cov57-Attheya_sp.AAC.1
MNEQDSLMKSHNSGCPICIKMLASLACICYSFHFVLLSLEFNSNLLNEEIKELIIPGKDNNNAIRDHESSNLPPCHTTLMPELVFPMQHDTTILGGHVVIIDPTTKPLMKLKILHREKFCKADDAIDKVALEVIPICTGVG